jgi:hypothetical protein
VVEGFNRNRALLKKSEKSNEKKRAFGHFEQLAILLKKSVLVHAIAGEHCTLAGISRRRAGASLLCLSWQANWFRT